MAGRDCRSRFPFSTTATVLLVSFMAIGCPLAVNGHQSVGVSLKLHGAPIPNNSLVDVGDLLYRTPDDPDPTNVNGLHDRTLVCETDLVDCCDSPRTTHGGWYYPDGTIVQLDAASHQRRFLSNRGPNEVINGQQFNGSVRLYYLWSGPPGKGRFRCELPSASNPNVNQTLYANIVDFGISYLHEQVTISSSGSNIAGGTYSLTCSATLIDPIPLPPDVPTPSFEWFFGPNGNASLPSGVTPMATILGSGNTYTSTLQFYPLSQSHAGKYTCRLGVGILANSTVIAVNAPEISIQITTSGSPVLGQNGYTLTCTVSGDHLKEVTGYCSHLCDAAKIFGPKGGRFRFHFGVSLKLHGAPIPNNSLVDVGDLLYRTPDDPDPTNVNGLHDRTLVCETDLVDCCDSPRTTRGDWYYPDGTIVQLDAASHQRRFLSNRGPNEVINGQQFNGSVRLYYLWSGPPGKGRFRCELPSASNPNVNQTLYANIVDFGISYLHEQVTISSSGSNIAGGTSSLTCSATLIDPIPLPPDVPTPSFEWFFGPNGNASLPSGVTPMATILDSGNTYTSTLQFYPLSQSHAGKYTCRLGVRILVNSTVIAVNAPEISIQITTSGSSVLGQNGYTLTCTVSGADNLNNPFITYHWTKDNGTLTQIQDGPDPKTISFSRLRLYDTGRYTCQATISSPYLSNDIRMTESREVRLSIPAATSVVLSTPNPGTVRPVGSAVTMTCTVELNPAVSDIPVTVSTVWTGPAGFMTTKTAQSVMGSTTTYTSTVMIGSFGRNESGVYNCTATVSSASSNLFLSDSRTSSAILRVTVGAYLSFNRTVYANNSVIQITEIGETIPYTAQNEGLQCITDRKPCCGNVRFQAGEWLFPNGTAVPTRDNSRSFYTNWGDDGSVNLNLLRSDTLLPLKTGRFCCVVPDANDVMQTLCIEMKLTVSAGVIVIGASIAGNTHTLACNVSGSEKFSTTLAYKWTKNNGTLTLVGSNSNTLTFSPLRLSDSGQYTCHVAASSNGVPSMLVANTSSQPFKVNIYVPKPTVSLHSNSPNPSLSESLLTLTCTVELTPAVDIPVTMNTAWTRPDGTAITSATRPEMKSLTLYVSLVSLHSVDSADSGNYTCTAGIDNGHQVSASTNINIVDGVFQLRLKSVDICQKWYSKISDESEQFSNFIKKALVGAIEYQCKCHFPITNILDRDVFICDDSPNRMTYRNVLLGTHNFNGTQIIGFIQDWVNTAPLIKIGGNYVIIDSGCPVAITSLGESIYQEKEMRLCANDPKYASCAEHLNDENISNCFQGCIVRNG